MHSSTSSSSSSSNTRIVDIDKFINELPKENFIGFSKICKWEGYWFVPALVKAAITFRTSFDARNDDVFLASSLKTGTTWLKALLFCIMQRQNHQTLDTTTTTTHDILTMKNPHSLVPTVEAVAYMGKAETAPAASGPRLLHTHLPHVMLPDSVKNSTCKIVYVARNPNDTVISSWHFYNSILKADQEPIQLEKLVDRFCSGMHPYGPFVGHVAGYWEESRKKPEKLLFVKYEDLKKDPKTQVMKIAEFLEMPFGDEEEVDEIVGRCSLERLKNLEVNKKGSKSFHNIPNSSFFRKGEVGDFKNYLTSQMEMKIHQTITLKLQGLGLYF